MIRYSCGGIRALKIKDKKMVLGIVTLTKPVCLLVTNIEPELLPIKGRWLIYLMIPTFLHQIIRYVLPHLFKNFILIIMIMYIYFYMYLQQILKKFITKEYVSITMAHI